MCACTWRGVDRRDWTAIGLALLCIPSHDSSYTGSAACILLDAPAQGSVCGLCVCVHNSA